MDKNIPLSALIRIGAKQTKQCFGAIQTDNWTQTCALGAAVLAKLGDPKAYISSKSAREILGISELVAYSLIHWNDSVRITREEIANNLEAQGL